MKSNRMLISAISGVLVIAVTLLVFFAAVEDRQTLQWVGLGFLVFAELIATFGFIYLDVRSSSSVFLRTGGYTILVLYVIASAIVSAIFWGGLARKLLWLVTFQAILIAAVVILGMALLTSARSVSQSNRTALNKSAAIRQMSDSILAMMQDETGKPYFASLEKIYEALRFSDSSLTVATDNDIYQKIGQLNAVLHSEGDDKDSQVTSAIDELLSLAAKREIEVKSGKRGDL